MGKTDVKFAALLKSCNRHARDPHYVAFFDCFNRQLYFEAHEVLEILWLRTPGSNYAFYKGLIQLAGAFVHVQKGRKGPALALLELSRGNLAGYPGMHEGLEVARVLELISRWAGKIREAPAGKEIELFRCETPALAVTPGPIPAG